MRTLTSTPDPDDVTWSCQPATDVGAATPRANPATRSLGTPLADVPWLRRVVYIPLACAR